MKLAKFVLDYAVLPAFAAVYMTYVGATATGKFETMVATSCATMMAILTLLTWMNNYDNNE